MVNRGLVAFALVWQGAWIATDPSLWPTHQVSVTSAVLCTGVLLTIPAIIITTWGRAWFRRWARLAVALNIVLLALTSFAMLGVDLLDVPNDWVAGASLVNLSAATAGLFLPMRIAVPVIIVIVAGEFVILTGRGGLGVEAPSLTSDALYAAYALAIGSAAAGSRYALSRSTMRAEQARASIGAAESAAQRIQERTDLLLAEEIKVHETALNTLTAIARGGIADDATMQQRIRVRADEAARVLGSLAQARDGEAFGADMARVEPATVDIDASVEDLRVSGVDVRMAGRLPEHLPVQVRWALLAAMREALSNVSRHAHATQVRIRISHGASRDGGMRVRIVISDNGVGFDPDEQPRGFGIQHAMDGALRNVGGRAFIRSAPTSGTRVAMEWPSQDHDAERLPSFLVSVVRSVALPVLFTIWVFSGLSLATTITKVDVPVLDVLAFGTYTAVLLLIVHQSRFGFLRWPVVVIIAAAGPLIYWLQDAALGTVPADQWNEWSSEALVAIMFVVAATGPLWSWVVVLGSWLITQGDVLTELTQPGTAVIVAGAILGYSLHRSVRDYQMRRDELAIAQRFVDASLADAQSLVARYASVSGSGVLELLERVAEGSVDPSSVEVRDSCRVHERHIRSMMGLDPARRQFDASLTSLSDQACERGVLLDIVVPDGLPDLGAEVIGEESGACALLGRMEPGSTARFSAHHEGDRVTLRCVGVCPDIGSIEAGSYSGGDIVLVDRETHTCMWEVIVDASGDRG